MGEIKKSRIFLRRLIMKMNRISILFFYGVIALVILGISTGCKKQRDLDSAYVPYMPKPYTYPTLNNFPPLEEPWDNPSTVEGVSLGRKLFYDPILSGDSTQSCGSCHNQEYNFSDNGLQFSVGIDGISGNRNSMVITNLAWARNFFWDGRSPQLEDQALEPVPNPIEMHLNWDDAIVRLKNHPTYPKEFYRAFQTFEIDSNLVAKALSQFMRTLISHQSKYDEVFATNPPNLSLFTPEELRGFEIFNNEEGDCFHCHGGVLFTDNAFHNNGLDEVPSDSGLYNVTKNPGDVAKFRSPTLRNIALSPPYMHDGRFATLSEVIDHYSFGLHESPTVDPLMKKIDQGGLLLSSSDKDALIAFLKTLTDSSFVQNPAYANPF